MNFKKLQHRNKSSQGRGNKNKRHEQRSPEEMENILLDPGRKATLFKSGRKGSGWRIHVNPWRIHVNVWQKSLQYCKVISLQLIKINAKKKWQKTWPFCFLPMGEKEELVINTLGYLAEISK